jgi:hypothetical protein
LLARISSLGLHFCDTEMQFYNHLAVLLATGIAYALWLHGVHSAPVCAAKRPGFGSAEHVVIIGTDGLGNAH